MQSSDASSDWTAPLRKREVFSFFTAYAPFRFAPAI